MVEEHHIACSDLYPVGVVSQAGSLDHGHLIQSRVAGIGDPLTVFELVAVEGIHRAADHLLTLGVEYLEHDEAGSAAGHADHVEAGAGEGEAGLGEVVGVNSDPVGAAHGVGRAIGIGIAEAVQAAGAGDLIGSVGYILPVEFVNLIDVFLLRSRAFLGDVLAIGALLVHLGFVGNQVCIVLEVQCGCRDDVDLTVVVHIAHIGNVVLHHIGDGVHAGPGCGVGGVDHLAALDFCLTIAGGDICAEAAGLSLGVFALIAAVPAALHMG